MIDKIYVIHLEPNNHVDDVLNRLNQLGVPEGTQFEIVQAYDGRYGDLPEGYSTYSDWFIEDSDNEWYNRPVKPGEAGCMISHIMVWEKMIADGVETALVLEEDFKASGSLKNLDISGLPEWEFMPLGRNALHGDEEIVLDNFVKPKEYYNSHAYLIKLSAVKKLVNDKVKANIIPSDEYLMAMQMKHPRKDVAKMFKPKLKSLATKENYVIQGRPFAESTTEQVLDYFEILDARDWATWTNKYINPIIARREWDLILDDLGDNIYEFPLFTEKFCTEVIALAEAKNNWTENRHDFYPTNDVLLQDIGMGKIYDQVLKDFVYPLCVHIWDLHGDDWLNMEAESFLARYTPDRQAHLSLHHDFSHVTVVVKLNDEFDGGGTWFPKYNKLSNPERVGTATLHPGMVTHLHGARPIYNGRRYITVSFMRKP